MDVYIARQPILSSDKTLSGFELLYRDSGDNFYNPNLDGNHATSAVLAEAISVFDLHKLTKGKVAYVNFTRDLLLQGTPMLLNPRQFAIEILEDVEFDAPVIEQMRKLKSAGYTLVLDDYIGDPIPEEVLTLVDTVKVDFIGADKARRKTIARDLLQYGKKMLAEKVETKEDFQEAVSYGYDLFQGYYFSKPVVLKKNAMDISSVSYMKLLKEISSEDIDLNKIANIIYPDAHMTYKLLKKMQTVQYYRGHTVTSIKHALVRMGINEVRRWIMLLLMRRAIGDDMDELLRIALIRAVFCECISEKLNSGTGNDAFLVGIFSIIESEDAAFDELMDNIQVSDTIKHALTGENQLANILRLIKLYENGNTEEVRDLLQKSFPDFKMQNLTPIYIAAVNYADSVLSQS